MASSPKIESEGVSAPVEDERQSPAPSKVVHFRNLPKKFSKEELIELCSPFGEVVNFICGIGVNKSQSLVEFADINEATSLVSHYASSSNQVQIRGRTSYVQYSERSEIDPKTSSSGNILLVTFEGAKIKDVSIDVIHSVFSANEFVQKISMFDKASGFQALIQYADNETAASVKNALDGTSIPKYLLPGHVERCDFSILYSEHQDLNIKYQTKRTRDYTNPTVPSPQHSTAKALKEKPPPTVNHVLSVSISNMQYDVTLDKLHEVISTYGTVQKITISKKDLYKMHALIQFPDVMTAAAAKEALDGQCLYNGGYCKLRISYSHHTNIFVQGPSENTRDYTGIDANESVAQASITTWQYPHVASMDPNAYPHVASMDPNAYAFHPQQAHGGQLQPWIPINGCMPTPDIFPNQVYTVPTHPVYVLDQSNLMVHDPNYMQTTPPGVPFSPYTQVGFAGFFPPYYGHY